MRALRFLIPGVFLLIPLGLFLYNVDRINKKAIKLREQYPEICFGDSVYDRIKYINTGDNLRNSSNAMLVIFGSDIMALIRVDFKSKGIELDDVANVGDTVFKRANSDSLFIIKMGSGGKERYGFTIRGCP